MSRKSTLARMWNRLKGMKLKAGRPERKLLECSRRGKWGLNSNEVLPHFTDQETVAHG